ncbi:imidazole glycerol phosphate synthase subunit HisH [Dehalobacterium formicoaceticum]|uniref:Imidazole glycerol phosphate synthase subunit HisH n=1 Tax=Dehalobacterium formicoaceticum TaxID=51515 RepID=A0ABT1Y8R4_9FIRM|nr:imidazole glycerol phosphate synthase subunit HisH [Dehalobacterium formicoaceticum]MCR6546886.1 imidazole glycerol phosphate synthase subunit HisH [Dehalobacterium formicoaceticum]
MIVIIDYGMGNLASVQKGIARTGFDGVISSTPEILSQADGIILPGVGAFEAGMKNLRERGFLPEIKKAVQAGKPLLGICLGMQLLFEEGEEHGIHQGLGLFPGRVVKFNHLPDQLKVPHMGWNQVRKAGDYPLLKNIPSDTYFYFVHSYYVIPANSSLIGGVTHYGIDFPAAVGEDRVFGIQFHPEKSSAWGMKLLKNFGELVENVSHSGH